MAYISQEAMDNAKLQRRRDSLHHTLLISLRAEEDAESCLYQAMSPVKVFGSAAFTNVARVLVCLEEVGAQYEVVDVDFLAKEHKGTEHLARNPFGQVPAFQDGDLMLFESRAICRYVLRKYRTPEGPNLLGDSDLAESALVDAWLDVEAVQYEPAVHAVFVQHRVVPALGGTPDEEAIRESVEKLRKVLGVYEARLGERRYHGRRRRQPGRPEPLPLHALPHGDAVRGGVRRVPSRKCVVAGPRGPAGGA